MRRSFSRRSGAAGGRRQSVRRDDALAAARREILLIAYHFPPSAAVGGQRIANFTRCLPGAGWRPSVLTIPRRAIEEIDTDRLEGIGAVTVHTAPMLPTVLATWTAARRWWKRRASRAASGPADRSGPSRTDVAAGGRASRSRGLVRWAYRQVLALLTLPDQDRGWIIPASLSAIRLVRRRRIEWIVTSCPPYSTHLVGLVVKLATGRRWAADFRDPWMMTGTKGVYVTSALSLRIEGWLERKVIEKADLVVFNVNRLRDAYRAQYGYLPPEKFVFVPNGISPQGASAQPPAKYDVFTVSYTGSLYVGRSPEPIFQAVSGLIQSGRIGPRSVRIRLIGHCRQVNGEPTSRLARRYGLDGMVEVQDPISHTDALDVVRKSHLALLLAPNLPFQIPAKVYDYLGAGSRILAIAESGGTADLVSESGAGRAFEAGDIDGIARFIYDEMQHPQSPNGHTAAFLRRFEISGLTADLVSHLDRVGGADARRDVR